MIQLATQVAVLWVMTPCTVVVGYQHFGGLAASIFRVKGMALGKGAQT
jgi:hypothetical protein